jgi:hypothetical protein
VCVDVTYVTFEAELPGPLLEAEASMAIMPTSTQEVTASVTTLGNRCAVLPLMNLLNEPLSMAYKFTAPNHTSAYVVPTNTQFCCIPFVTRKYTLTNDVDKCQKSQLFDY